MANGLTSLIPTMYKAMDVVSREIVGMIPAVSIDASAETAAVNQDITTPIVPTAKAKDITPGVTPADDGNQEIGNVTMKITKSRGVPVMWNGEEQKGLRSAGTYSSTLEGQFAQAFRTLANEIEQDLGGTYRKASRAYGTPGVTPFATDLTDSAQVLKILKDNGAPQSDLQLVIDTSAGAKMRSNGHLTKVNEAGGDVTLRHGELLRVHGFSIRESAGIATHSAGSITGSALSNLPAGYDIGASNIAFDGATASSLKAGDVVSFAGSTAKYVVSADSSVTPLRIAAPGLMSPLADNTAISVAGSYTANMAFDRNAIKLLTRTPAMPEGGDAADDVIYITDPISGLVFQIALYRIYRSVKYEVGIAWGVELIKPEHTALLLG